MKRLAAFLWMVSSISAAHASGLERLEHFMRSAQAGRAEFTQTVTAPAKGGAGAPAPRSKVSGGHFAFQRPGRFKFVYTRPFEQTIVADGTNLWLYDADLHQVTVRAQADALGNTPAALLAASADLQALRRDFDLQDVEAAAHAPNASDTPTAPEASTLHWVQATPKDDNSTIARVRAGFGAQGQLAALDILDHFGQRSYIHFGPMDTQAALPASTFVFTPPAGADVLRP